MMTQPASDNGQTSSEKSSEKSSETSSAGAPAIRPASSLRTPRTPLIDRRLWILGVQSPRVEVMEKALKAAGHEVRTAATGAELAPSLREFRPHIIIIDMEGEHERGRHIATQLRADRATRQVPVILVAAEGIVLKTTDKPITGPTRCYIGALDEPSVINAVLTELL